MYITVFIYLFIFWFECFEGVSQPLDFINTLKGNTNDKINVLKNLFFPLQVV